LDKINFTTRQERTGTAKRSSRPDPADQIISDARKPYLLHALLMLIRRRNNGLGFLSDDAHDRPLAITLCALKARKAKLDNVLPWLRLMPRAEREAFEQSVDRFKPTLRNIAQAARLTRADRDKYGNATRRVDGKIRRPMQALLQLPVIDADLTTERREARNAGQRKRRQRKQAAIARHRQCDRAARQAKRRANGTLPRAAYLAGSVAAAVPWRAEGIGRTTWYERRRTASRTGVSTFNLESRHTCPTAPKLLQYQGFTMASDDAKPETEPKKARPGFTANDLGGMATPSHEHGLPMQKRLGEAEFASASLPPLDTSTAELAASAHEDIMDDIDDEEGIELTEWAPAMVRARARKSLPGIRGELAALERETLAALMTLPEVLQAKLMVLRQEIAGVEAALMTRATSGAMR
jgi:hypothetical protein